ncbi:G-type lectin S-receptor-like serine/threonine-protein kinase [Actinidia chinensis var. chinensis]|uniref:G-type lectin S-receptor-like serine/threonine-protein kinase n=1 Tax=Actinidia chinensis var. chinensis TaxID=1590841 RepID=A0A2R6PI82_ACTCC|nr:G-type lectin S-receptor-like serine/threonine-protein kinase [Actinidia chinensis var. chinensis]
MVGLGCTIDGHLNDSKYSQPIPWIGLYIAAASAACAIAMAADAFIGFRHRKLWFPCKYFSLNATTLTLIAVAAKLSVDLNASMPRRQDQLAKLSSATLICTVMGNFLPSIGTMENKEILMNIMALGILVITAIVNICTQLGTGVIFVFWKEHAFVMFLMLVLLAILSSSALTVPITKRYLDLKYNKKHELAMEECSDKTGKCIAEKLRRDLAKFWMMAHTCNPQFVIGRSATCTASGAFCLLAAMTLAEAVLRSYLMPWSFKFCNGDSDYKWSTTLVLITQIVAVVVGTIAPAFRWFIAIHFRCPTKATKACKSQFRVESYWSQWLVEGKECPLGLRFGGRNCKRLAHKAKTLLLDLCIRVQSGIVLASKVVRLISIFSMSLFLIFSRYCKEMKTSLKLKNSIANNDSGSESQTGLKLDLRRFVLHLEGEEALVDLMIENHCDASDPWFFAGKKKQPKPLIQLLEKSKSLRELKGVSEFDSYQVPSLEAEEPPNCWSLPVVTLTSIAISLPGIENHLVKQLIRSVNEGLVYVRIVENNLNDKPEFSNVRTAAEVLWLRVDLYHRWLDVDLRKMAGQGKSPEKVLEELADIAKNKFWELKPKDIQGCLRENPSKWPLKVLIANSMYRISQTILSDFKARDYDSSERLFERLCAMIAEILGACLTNLPRVIPMECQRSAIEKREESVRRAILLLGKAETILKILDQELLLSSDPEQLACIDNWRSSRKQKNPLQFGFPSTVSCTAAFSSSDIHLSIE